jgi:hypothetical protein
MAHPNLHIAVGMVLGVALTLPWVIAELVRGRPLRRSIGRLLVASYGLGVVALVPTALPLPAGPWLNLFALHALVDRWKPDGRGLLIGELLIAATIAGQYLLILCALLRARYIPPQGGANTGAAAR